jgi:hypothetical protein
MVGSANRARRPARVAIDAVALASADAADAAGAPIEAALSRTIAGRALAATGEKDRAVAQLQHAAAALGACGAWRYRQGADENCESSAITSTGAPGQAPPAGGKRHRRRS